MSKAMRGVHWSSAFSSPMRPPLLMIVDDDRNILAMYEAMMKQQGYQVVSASSGEECVHLLSQHGDAVDAIILDQQMQGISGLQVVARMKNDPRLASVPVIMATGQDSSDQIIDGINAGIYYYLTKPVNQALFKTIVAAALREKLQRFSMLNELDRYGSAMQGLQSFQMKVRTLQEAEDAACFVAACFPNPQKTVSGLMELIINAVEHGNLGITYDEKCKLLAANDWRSEIERRLTLPENQHKCAEVLFQRRDGCCLAQITDQGEGFDWRLYWHINPSRAGASNGRGITRARLMAFERMSYNEKGNSVTVMVSENSGNSGDYAW